MAKSKYRAESERDRCIACGVCVKVCPREAIHIHHGLWSEVDADLCVGCGQCVKACPAGVMHKLERTA